MLFRCADVDTTMQSVAGVLGVSSDALAEAIPTAAAIASTNGEDPDGAITPALEEVLGARMTEPDEVRYFHGTRTRDPDAFASEGLLPLWQVVDRIWAQLAALVPELGPADLEPLRRDLTSGAAGPPTYSTRINGTIDHGPNGQLIRDTVLNANAYGNVDVLAGAEIVIDICAAIRERFDIDAAQRYQDATQPCIVEFSAPPNHIRRAVAAALWCIDAGEPTTRADWTYDNNGEAIPPERIVDVELLSREHRATE